MFKRLTLYVGAVLLVLGSVQVVHAQDSGFKPEDQVEDEIEVYYKEVLGKMLVKVYIIEIAASEEDSNFMYVYFLEDKDPKTHKDLYNNINSSKIPVMVATFNYSYLKYKWRLKKVGRVKGKIVFKIEDE